MTTKVKIKTRVRYNTVLDTGKFIQDTQSSDKLSGTETLEQWFEKERGKQKNFALIKHDNVYQWDISGKWWNDGVVSDTETISIHKDVLVEEEIVLDDWLDETYAKFEEWFNMELGEKFQSGNQSLDDHEATA